jgi:hypothetical protein
MNPRIVGADGHDREIDRLSQLCETVRHRGVASKKNAPSVSLHDVAIVAAIIITLFSRAPVSYVKSANSNVAYGLARSVQDFRFTPAKFCYLPETCPSYQVCRVRSSDYAGVFIKTVERAQVEMIEVRVG